VTKETLASERERYADRPMVQKMWFDLYFNAYFKMQTGRYIDNMMLPGDKKTHLEMITDGDDLDGFYWDTSEARDHITLDDK
jgi:hypothetical protein